MSAPPCDERDPWHVRCGRALIPFLRTGQLHRLWKLCNRVSNAGDDLSELIHDETARRNVRRAKQRVRELGTRYARELQDEEGNDQHGCICEWPSDCGGDAYVACNGCGGDQCVCECGGERECFGCDACREEGAHNDGFGL